MKKLWKRLMRAAIANAADVMDSVDPDDRREAEIEEVDAVKDLMILAQDDLELRALMVEAVPSWESVWDQAEWSGRVDQPKSAISCAKRTTSGLGPLANRPGEKPGAPNSGSQASS